MTLALDDAWWLRISRDRDHAIGYGALPQRMAVAADAFAFDALVALLEPRAEPRGLGTTVGPECRFTVLFERTGGPEDSLSHALPADLCPTLRALFRRAWLGRQPDRSFAADATTVERFWRAAPFVVNRDSIPAHGDPDAR